MKNVSQIITELKQEIRALKIASAQSATRFTLQTKTLTFSTAKNAVTESGPDYSVTYEEQERVVVTLATAQGENTLAKLEISGDFSVAPIVRRVPFSGGARWVVTGPPKLSGAGWSPTTYNFVVQTLINGTLSAEMVREVS